MFFSSHILTEVDKVCDRVGIIKDGSLVALENIDSLKKKKGKILKVKIKEKPEKNQWPSDAKIQDGWIQFIVSDNIDFWIKKLSKFTVLDFQINEFSLEDIFIHFYERKEK